MTVVIRIECMPHDDNISMFHAITVYIEYTVCIIYHRRGIQENRLAFLLKRERALSLLSGDNALFFMTYITFAGYVCIKDQKIYE